MKKLLLCLLVIPFMGYAQTSEYLMFEISFIKVMPSRIQNFEAAVASHNKAYYPAGPHGARVYTITGGKNSGNYAWVMGPTHWSSLDTRPDDKAHNMDWEGNVLPNTVEDAGTVYLKFDNELSRFPQDFMLKRLFVMYYDLKSNSEEKINELLKKIHQVYKEKYPTDTYGIYYNELPSTSEGNDLIIVWYFDSYKWMSEDSKFKTKYEEVHGSGSWDAFLKDWDDNVQGRESEIWSFRDDLSGMTGKVTVTERQ